MVDAERIMFFRNKAGVVFAATVLILALWPSVAPARNCTCKNIGLGVCIPDPACQETDYLANTYVRKEIENALRQVGHSTEKTAHDIGAILEKSSRENTITRMTILDTGFKQLPELGKEESGYGLYSYAVLTSNSEQAVAFLAEIFKSIPNIEDTQAQRAQLNIFYLPLKKDTVDNFANELRSSAQQPAALGAKFAASFYDYKMARGILNHICNPPADEMRELCQGDMSRGPYIFTYAKPASTLEPVPPPFLFVDLGDIDSRAYPEILSAFKAQVKRDDISDGSRIKSLRLRILNIALKASSFVGPVKKAIADIVHSADNTDSK
jgi:hypothetical protein